MWQESKCIVNEHSNKLHPPQKQDILNWIYSAVKHLKDNADVIRKLFVVTGISNKLNGSEDHLVRNDIPDIFTEDDDDILFEGFTAEEVQVAINALNELML